jgi:hypothetical protein
LRDELIEHYFGFRPLVGVLLKETNCQRPPRRAAIMMSSPLGGTFALPSPPRLKAEQSIVWLVGDCGRAVLGCRAGRGSRKPPRGPVLSWASLSRGAYLYADPRARSRTLTGG